MLWTLRPPRAWPLPCRRPVRPFSFTPNARLPRAVKAELSEVPIFRKEVAKETPIPSFADIVRKVPIRNQVLFTVAGTVTALAVGAHLTNYELFKWWAHLRMSPQGSYDKSRPPTSEELSRVKYFTLGRTLQTTLASLKASVDQLPQTMQAMVTYTYVQVFQPILNASEGKRMCWAIGAVNVLVWAAWRVPRWNAFMMSSFAHNPLSGKSYTLLTSTFSHKSFFHLLFNCMALASFGAAASQELLVQFKKVEAERGALSEASPRWHLLALFVSAGLFSSLFSHVARARWDYPRLITRLQAAAKASASGTSSSALRAQSPSRLRAFITSESAEEIAHAVQKESNRAAKEGWWSLGSSGAIYALFAVTALGFPDAEIALMIPPSFPINIQTGFGILVAFDVLGVLRGWRILDHFAHLGGALFGYFWFKYGAEIWYTFRVWDLPAAFYLHGHGTVLKR